MHHTIRPSCFAAASAYALSACATNSLARREAHVDEAIRLLVSPSQMPFRPPQQEGKLCSYVFHSRAQIPQQVCQTSHSLTGHGHVRKMKQSDSYDFS